MALLRLIIVIYCLVISFRSQASIADTTKRFTFGAAISKSLESAFKRNLSTEFFTRYKFGTFYLQITGGYDKLKLAIPNSQNNNVPYTLSENPYNLTDGYHFRIGAAKNYNIRLINRINPISLSVGLNVNYVYYRHKIKLKYFGYYIDNIYYYNYYNSYKLFVEPELNVVMLKSKNKKYQLELNNRLGFLMKSPINNPILYQMPGQNSLPNRLTCYTFLSFVFHYNFNL